MFNNTAIYTIGYGNRKIETFVSILHQYGITIIVDIRSKPYSRFQPAYNKTAFQNHLSSVGIGYLYKGDDLGGKPSNELLYTNGKLNYSLVESTKQYRNALIEIVTMTSVGERVCLICAELDENTCHRKNLVGASLNKMGVTVLHIDRFGGLKPHTTGSSDLFTL